MVAKTLGGRIVEKVLGLRAVPLTLAKILFYVYGFLWALRPRTVRTMEDVHRLFYLDFLRLDEKEVEVVRLDGNVLTTRCKNPCPILKLSLYLKVDTKVSCRMVSEPVCRYVLRRLDRRLTFRRNYEHIRPYSESCEETIQWVG